MLDALGANTQEGNGMVATHQAWVKSQATAKVGQCRLTVSKPVLKAPLVSEIESTI